MLSSTWFWDKLARRYSRQKVADESAYQQKLKVTQGYFTPESQVLEIGCGTGTTALIHATHVAHILATDFSGKMIEIAQGKADAAQVENVEFRQVAIDDLRPEPESYDMVMAHSILHLLEDREAAIRLAFDALKPGGVFVSSTICMGDGKRLLRGVLGVGHKVGVLPLVKFFSDVDLTRSIVSAGFEIDHSSKPGTDDVLFLVAQKLA